MESTVSLSKTKTSWHGLLIHNMKFELNLKSKKKIIIEIQIEQNECKEKFTAGNTTMYTNRPPQFASK